MADVVFYRPKLTQKQFEEYVESYHSLVRDRKGGKIPQETYIRERARLNDGLDSRIDPMDRRVFKTIDDLNVFLQGLVTPDLLQSIIEHELSHGTEAELLGHTVEYGTFLMLGYSGQLVAVPFTQVVTESSVTCFDKISNAPVEPSVYDKL